VQQRADNAEHPQGWKPAVRVDVGKLRKAERTPSGGVRVPGAVARAGVLEYRRADGSTVRELVLPEEVRRLESLRSLRDAVVTVGHPDGGLRLVTPETFRRDSVGHVSGEPRADGDLVLADLAVLDADTVRRIDAGELVEISAGYRVWIDPTPGIWQGQRYDQVQRNREYNHVALLPPGGGRAGATVSLRLDGEGDAAVEVRGDESTVPNRITPAPAPEMRADAMKTQRIDGIEYEIGTPSWAQACERRDTAAAEERAALDKRAKEAETANATQTARADAAEKRVKELEAELEPARLDARVATRTALLERVRPVLGADVKLDGKGELDVMQLALEKLEPGFKADAIPEAQRETYVRARFDAEMKHAGKVSPVVNARADATRSPTPAPTQTVPAGHNKHTLGRSAPGTVR
jgi:hypothetical protein